MAIIKVLRFQNNEQGRDFIIGDLHGCRTLFDELLNQVNFNPTLDRVFSVGDLADRGPESMEALELLREPWFHSVLGNHEVNLLNCFRARAGTSRIRGCWEFYGDLWGCEWLEDEVTDDYQPSVPLQRILDRIQELPHVIVVGDGEQRFNIVHAELYDPKRKSICLDADIDSNFARDNELHQYPLIESITEGRSLFNYPKLGRDWIRGLSTTYCGHSVQKQVTQQLSHINLDTGACLSGLKKYEGEYKLTMAQANSDLYFALHAPTT